MQYSAVQYILLQCSEGLRPLLGLEGSQCALTALRTLQEQQHCQQLDAVLVNSAQCTVHSVLCTVHCAVAAVLSGDLTSAQPLQ